MRRPITELAQIISLLEAAENRRYREIERAGEGGHAYTFRARDSRNGNRLVAIKIPKNAIPGDKHPAETDIVDEGMRAAKLGEHFNIVRIYGFVKYGQEKRGLVMEFIEGGSLRQIMRNLNGDIESSVKIAAGICKALMLAHEYYDPIVHRDVKPENILMGDHVTPKLTDFGIATEPSSLPPEQVVGSLYYMAPEYLRYDGHTADPRSDLYSLTVVLFEMLQGHIPFYAENTTAVINRIKNDPPPALRDDLPVSLRKIVYKGLQKKPEERYQSAREMLFDLEQFLVFYTEIFVALEKIEAGLFEGCNDRKERAKKYLFLSEMYLELATATMGSIDADLIPEPQRTQLQIRLALLERMHEFGGDSDPKDVGNITEALQPERCGFGSPIDSQSTTADLSSGEENLEQQVAEIKKLLEQEQSIELAKSRAQDLLSRERSVNAHYRVAEMFFELRLFDQAITICDTALKENGDHAELYAIRGRALHYLGRDDQKNEALQSLKKAVDLGTLDDDAKDLYKIYGSHVHG